MARKDLRTLRSFKDAAWTSSAAYYDTCPSPIGVCFASLFAQSLLHLLYPKSINTLDPSQFSALSSIINPTQSIPGQQTDKRTQSSRDHTAIMSYDCNCCQRRFNSQHAQRQHKADKNHFDYECNCCYETYETERMRKEHEVEDHHYCADCDRSFRNLNNIQQHLRSAAHLGASIICPFCKRGFATATGLVHHIENSACPKAKNLDRDAVYSLVRQKDPSGLISKKLIGWTGSDSFQATARTWNPYAGAYECYLCNRTFAQLSSLNQHLQSPARELTSSVPCVLLNSADPAQTSRNCTTARSAPRSL